MGMDQVWFPRSDDLKCPPEAFTDKTGHDRQTGAVSFFAAGMQALDGHGGAGIQLGQIAIMGSQYIEGMSI